MEKYYIILTNKNDYVVLGSYETLENAEMSLCWYNKHKKFFNGDFSIEKEEI